MRTSRALVTIALIGVLGGVSYIYAQRSGGSGTLTGADIAEIERLYYRYSQGLDFQEEETYLSAWADDAVFTQGVFEAVGPLESGHADGDLTVVAGRDGVGGLRNEAGHEQHD